MHTRSPYDLLQERAAAGAHPEWRVAFTAILLNKTNGDQVRPIFDEIFEMFPGPRDFLRASVAQTSRLVAILRPLGLITRRMLNLRRMTEDFVRGNPISKCYGCGQYAVDSVETFCHHRPSNLSNDPWIQKYIEWLETTSVKA